MKLSNIFNQFVLKVVNAKSKSKRFFYQIVFKPGAIDSIKKVKGWRTDAEMARNLYPPITRQYICLLKKNKAGVTSNVILSIATALGLIEGSWWTHFEIVPVGFYNANDPKYNMAKMNGEMPYDKYSICGEARKQDFEVEKL